MQVQRTWNNDKRQTNKKSNNTIYLGIILDNKLTAKQHIESIITKAQNHSTMLKILAEYKLGENMAFLNNTPIEQMSSQFSNMEEKQCP